MWPLTCGYVGALGGTRTPNLLIRSQMLYPLSYERTNQQYTAVRALTVRAADACTAHSGVEHVGVLDHDE
jgi:hypothetical protein